MVEDEETRAVTDEVTGDPAWIVGEGIGIVEVKNSVTLEIGWDCAGAWAGDEATGAGACTAA